MDSPIEATEMQAKDERAVEEQSAKSEREIPCPVCGHPMPDLKGGKDAICSVCGFKDSCCY